MLFEREIDLSFKAQNLISLVDLEDFIEITGPCFSENLNFGQFLSRPTTKNEGSLAFLSHSKVVINIIVIGCLIALLISLFFQPNKSKTTDVARNASALARQFANKIKRFSLTLSGGHEEARLLNNYNLIMLSLFVFLLINMNLLRSLIKTNGVIINLSEVIDSKAKLLETERYYCHFADASNFDYIRWLGKEGYLARILQKRMPGGDCVIEQFLGAPNRLKKFEHSKAFFLMTKLRLAYILSAFSKVAQQKIAFESSFLDFQVLHAYLISARLEAGLKAKLLYK